MTSSLTTALEEMTINNEQLRREVDVLKTDNTRLRTDNDAMKNENEQLKANNNAMKDENKQLKANSDKERDEIGELKAENMITKDESKQLTTLLDKMAVNNENQIQQINSQCSEIVQLRTENQQLKVSQWSVITFTYMGVFWFHDTLFM